MVTHFFLTHPVNGLLIVWLVCGILDAVTNRKVCHEKNLDLKSVQGNILKSVIRRMKSDGGIQTDYIDGQCQDVLHK